MSPKTQEETLSRTLTRLIHGAGGLEGGGTPISGWLNKEEKGGKKGRGSHIFTRPQQDFPSLPVNRTSFITKPMSPSTQRTQGTTLRKARRGLPRSDSCFSPAWLEVKNAGFLLFGETYWSDCRLNKEGIDVKERIGGKMVGP